MPIFEFDRYVRGQKMAEGARITKAANDAEALQMARALFTKPGYGNYNEMRATKFVLVNVIEN